MSPILSPSATVSPSSGSVTTLRATNPATTGYNNLGIGQANLASGRFKTFYLGRDILLSHNGLNRANFAIPAGVRFWQRKNSTANSDHLRASRAKLDPGHYIAGQHRASRNHGTVLYGHGRAVRR